MHKRINHQRRFLRGVFLPVVIMAIATIGACGDNDDEEVSSYDGLLSLFEDWREFEQPPLLDGAPDYTAARFSAAHAKLKDYQARLTAIDRSGWSIEQQVD